ncbi:phosphotransferase [Bacillus tianshenii]|uniref:phosphotransferase n=1 Tax=Sutcliffiella tianshenii TaxID=1463404 RepID=UPI001CD1BB81|nr:phosphotransferase [Bacillus tianshenii]MCA1320623.1 phosphotransferase [Bacillus tianshenii]
MGVFQVDEIHKEILEDISETCLRVYGMEIMDSFPIYRGWLNLKWQVRTEQGMYLIKQFNKERFQKYSNEELHFAYTQQERLFLHNVPCPKLFPIDRQYLLKSGKGERFMIMEFCKGSILQPGTATELHMYQLGKATGRMHRVLNDANTPRKKNPEFIAPSLEHRINYWHSVLKDAEGKRKQSIISIIEKQMQVTQSMKLEDFTLHDTGWAHRDLFMDNILFQEDQVSAILDFDRLKYDYPQLDVARAVISGCLSDNGLNVSAATAFMEGYKEERKVDEGYLYKALCLLWYMESTWWIEADMDEFIGPPVRFAEEMLWLGENLQELESWLNDL